MNQIVDVSKATSETIRDRLNLPLAGASNLRHRPPTAVIVPKMRPQLPPAGAVLFVLTVNGPGSQPQLCLGEARNGGSRGKFWKQVIPIERGKYRAQHHHADGQPQDPRRDVIDLIEADIAFISKSHDVCPLLRSRAAIPPPMIRHEFITK